MLSKSEKWVFFFQVVNMTTLCSINVLLLLFVIKLITIINCDNVVFPTDDEDDDERSFRFNGAINQRSGM